MNYQRISSVLRLCASAYKLETYMHCLRVAEYAANNVVVKDDEDNRETAYILGLCHDLLEDTEVTLEHISEATGYSLGFLGNVLGALTKQSGESYVDYIQRVKSNSSFYTYVVKLADMKDHLTQVNTLTDKLKEKYWKALPYLL
nr:MAG TPA: pyrophosphohydrolase [Bacteriophage sp.]